LKFLIEKSLKSYPLKQGYKKTSPLPASLGLVLSINPLKLNLMNYKDDYFLLKKQIQEESNMLPCHFGSSEPKCCGYPPRDGLRYSICNLLLENFM